MTRLFSLIAAAAATFAPISAMATHQPGHNPSAANARGSAVAAQTAAENDNPSMAWRIARYPGRVGMTVLRSPIIVGETFTGRRSFVSSRGFFQAREEAAQASPPQGRGQRSVR